MPCEVPTIKPVDRAQLVGCYGDSYVGGYVGCHGDSYVGSDVGSPVGCYVGGLDEARAVPNPIRSGRSARPVDSRSRKSSGRATLAHMGRRRLPPSPALLAASAGMSELALSQGGVVNAAQCRALGVDDAAVRRLLAAGLWTRAFRGIYADAAFVPRAPKPTGRDQPGEVVADSTHHAQCAALLACLTRPAVVSHLSAVRLLGLPVPPHPLEPRACITRRAPAPTNDPLLGDVHVVDYDESDVIDVAGVAVLAGPRLVLDCCDVLPPDSALAVADAALARELTTPGALRRALRRRYTRSRAADLIIERVVERADPLAENWFECSDDQVQ